MNEIDDGLGGVEPLLSSLSHDLKELIRSNRRRIERMVDAAAEAGRAADVEALEQLNVALSGFGNEVKAFRDETEGVTMDFEGLARSMAGRMSGLLQEYADGVRDMGKPLRERLAKQSPKDFRLLQQTARRLERHFESIREFAESRGRLKRSYFGVHNEVQRVVDDLAALVASHDATVEVSGEADIFADQLKVALVLQNLIHNAIRFRREGVPPLIEVTIHGRSARPFEETSNLLIEVSDNGRGMSERQVLEAFDFLVRWESDSDDEGSGVGLAIVRSVVERHKGRVWIESEPGVGTSISFTLPRPGKLPRRGRPARSSRSKKVRGKRKQSRRRSRDSKR